MPSLPPLTWPSCPISSACTRSRIRTHAHPRAHVPPDPHAPSPWCRTHACVACLFVLFSCNIFLPLPLYIQYIEYLCAKRPKKKGPELGASETCRMTVLLNTLMNSRGRRLSQTHTFYFCAWPNRIHIMKSISIIIKILEPVSRCACNIRNSFWRSIYIKYMADMNRRCCRIVKGIIFLRIRYSWWFKEINSVGEIQVDICFNSAEQKPGLAVTSLRHDWRTRST